MFNFFRKKRKALAGENRSLKYMRYAVGEIILVVIGILIALQINTWNENQKLRTQEIIYLDNLKNDIITQIQMLDVYIDFENIIIDQTNDITKHFELNDGFKNMDSIFPKINDLTTRWTFSNANMTLLQLLNSNQINIIQNRQLREELIAYNQQIDLFAKNTNINNTNLVDNFTTQTFIEIGSYALYGHSDRMLKKYNDFYPFIINTITNNELKNTTMLLINEPKNKLELINKIVWRNALSNLQKSGNQAVKEKSEQILLLLENEIELHK